MPPCIPCESSVPHLCCYVEGRAVPMSGMKRMQRLLECNWHIGIQLSRAAIRRSEPNDIPCPYVIRMRQVDRTATRQAQKTRRAVQCPGSYSSRPFVIIHSFSVGSTFCRHTLHSMGKLQKAVTKHRSEPWQLISQLKIRTTAAAASSTTRPTAAKSLREVARRYAPPSHVCNLCGNLSAMTSLE